MRSSSIAIVLVLAVSTSLAVVSADFSRYQVILARKPFGEPPPPPPSPPPKPPLPPPPPFVKDLRMCAITEDDLGIRVGFVNKKSKQNYFLRIGESEDGIEMVDADYDMECALLRKGVQEHWIYLNEKARLAGPPQSHSGESVGGVSQPGKTAAKPGSLSAKRMSYTKRLRMRREALRHRMMPPPKLTPEELEKQLKEYQMDRIRKGLKPLPIPLTKEMDDQLVKEGVLPPEEE